MSEAIKAAALRLYDVYNTPNINLLDEIFTPNYIGHVNGTDITDMTVSKSFVSGFMTAFPDAKYTVEDVMVLNSRVITRWTATATHAGDFLGVPATNKKVTMNGITIFQIENDKIAELWDNWDALGLMQQLKG